MIKHFSCNLQLPQQRPNCFSAAATSAHSSAAAAQRLLHLAQVAQVLLVLAMLGDQLDCHRLQAAGAPRLPYLQPHQLGSQLRRSWAAAAHGSSTGNTSWPPLANAPCQSFPRPQVRSACTRQSGSDQASCNGEQGKGVGALPHDRSGGGGGTAAAGSAAARPASPALVTMLRMWAAGGTAGGDGQGSGGVAPARAPARLGVPSRDHSRISVSIALPGPSGAKPLRQNQLMRPEGWQRVGCWRLLLVSRTDRW